jgi:hypothetical protein
MYGVSNTHGIDKERIQNFGRKTRKEETIRKA